jgi:hypothetical protein
MLLWRKNSPRSPADLSLAGLSWMRTELMFLDPSGPVLGEARGGTQAAWKQ